MRGACAAIASPLVVALAAQFAMVTVALALPVMPSQTEAGHRGSHVVPARLVSAVQPQDHAPMLDFFPLRLGARWIYDVTLDVDARPDPVSWQGEVTQTVVDLHEEAGVVIAEVDADGPPGRPEELRTVFYAAVDDHLYRLRPGHDLNEFIAGRGVGFEANLLAVLPAAVGDQWGAPEFLARGDGFYVQRVDAIETLETPAGTFDDCRVLAFFTNPDHTLEWLCPGVGIVRFEYHHHGTRDDEVWVLRAVE